MALDTTTVWEIRTDGDANNGGGFVPASGGTDYSQQASAQLSLTDLACANNTTLTSATGGFTSAMVGNLIRIASGTNFAAGWYQIAAHTDTNTVTLDRNPTTGSNATGGSGKVGGALNGLAAALGTGGAAVAGNIIFMASGTYTITAQIEIRITGTYYLPINVVAYSASRTLYSPDNEPATITCATNSVALLNFNGITWVHFRNFLFSHTASTRGAGVTNATGVSVVHFTRCRWTGCVSAFLGNGSGAGWNFIAVTCKCIIENCTSHGVNQAHVNQSIQGIIDFGSTIRNNAGSGIHRLGGATVLKRTLIYGNGVHGVHCANTTTTAGWAGTFEATNCTIAQNTDDGIRVISSSGSGAFGSFILVNCLLYDHTYNVAMEDSTATRLSWRSVSGNAMGGATSGNRLNFAEADGDVILTASPFVNAAGGDFALNNTPGGGAACRGVGLNGADLGAFQSAASGGGGRPPRIWQVNGGAAVPVY